VPDNLHDPFAWLTNESATFFAPAIRANFSLIETGIDRHGSIEWVAGRQGLDIYLYIILAIAQLGARDEELPCEIEVSIGADDGASRFTRQSIGSRMVADGRSSLREESGWIVDSVGVATQRVQLIQVQDLISSRAISSRRPSP
jgi:hypothetical protein